MGVMTYRVHSPSLHRCDYCHKASHDFYKVKLGEMEVRVCSGYHADLAAKNYYDKINKGINPTIVSDSEMEQPNNEQQS